MWPTEYMVHEHGKELRRIAAQVALEREAKTPQRTRWMAVLSRIALRLRRSRPIEIGELAPRVTRLERAR